MASQQFKALEDVTLLNTTFGKRLPCRNDAFTGTAVKPTHGFDNSKRIFIIKKRLYITFIPVLALSLLFTASVQLLLFLQHTEVCKYFCVVTQCLQELQTLIILVTYLLRHHHERYLQVQKCISARTEIGIGEKRKTTLVTKTQGQSCLQMQHRLSSSTKRSRAVQVKQTSRCPQGPYATHSNGSAHTAHHSSMSPLLWLHFFPSSTTSTLGGEEKLHFQICTNFKSMNNKP